MSDAKNGLLLLFQKPTEPLFTAKNDGRTAFDVPEAFFTDRYRPLGADLSTRFGDDATDKIVVKPLTTYPDLSFASTLSIGGGFALFNQQHKAMAGKLMEIFIDQPDVTSLLSVACYTKDRVNAYLFQYALSVAVQHRSDTKDLTSKIPSIIAMFPDNFVDPSAFPKAREEASVVGEGARLQINIPMEFTSNDKEVEQKLAYFREGMCATVTR